MKRLLLATSALVTLTCHSHAQLLGVAKTVSASSSLSVSCAGTGSTSSTILCSGSYTGTAPATSGWSGAWNSTCSGASTISGLTVSGGTWSGTATTPASACAGTLTITTNIPTSNSSASVTISGGALWSQVLDIPTVSVSPGPNITTAPADTSTATVLGVSMGWYTGGGGYNPGCVPILTDNKGNSWNQLTLENHSTYGIVLFYAFPTGGQVGAGHTFTMNASHDACTGNFYGNMTVVPFKGSVTPSFGSQNGNFVTSGNTIQPGSVTPVGNNALIMTGALQDADNTNSINSGFTIVGTHYSAWLSQNTAAAINPTWTTAGGLVEYDAVIMVINP